MGEIYGKALDTVFGAADSIEKKYDIKVNISFVTAYELSNVPPIDTKYLIAFIAFTFGAISGGFLSAIGKDLWLTAKKFCKKLFNPGMLHGNCDIIMSFEYQNNQIMAIYLNNEPPNDGYSLEKFFDTLPEQLDDLREIINKKPELFDHRGSIILSFDRSWSIGTYPDRMDDRKVYRLVKGYLTHREINASDPRHDESI